MLYDTCDMSALVLEAALRVTAGRWLSRLKVSERKMQRMDPGNEKRYQIVCEKLARMRGYHVLFVDHVSTLTRVSCHIARKTIEVIREAPYTPHTKKTEKTSSRRHRSFSPHTR